ncbi:MAG: Maf family nucleotide pyrophosphatase [Cyclobacteriaceae bacterium]|nr:Maf family nucleotide pyrophosphatase [Cyclobacteriaceae bacterium]
MSIYLDFNPPLVLASKSPRRQQLLRELGFNFTIKAKDTDESYPENLSPEDVPSFLAIKKAKALLNEVEDEIIIASDTIVVLEKTILGKPKDYDHAYEMISNLSGKTHQVITGVCLLNKTKQVVFSDTTQVKLKNLSKEEIDYYIKRCKPFDKAGAYGIQEWLGMAAIERIEGSYFNVMGLPTHKLYTELLKFNQ